MPWIYLAFDGGIDMIQDGFNQSQEISRGWDSLWLSIFGTSSGLWMSIISFASILTFGAFAVFSVMFAEQLLNQGISPLFRQVVWILLVMGLLANNGRFAQGTVLGLRTMINEKTNQVFLIQIGEISMREALQDVLITSDVKSQIQARFNSCQAKVGEAQLECFRIEGARAREDIEAAESRFGRFAGLVRLLERIGRGAPESSPYTDLSPFLTGLMGAPEQALVRVVLRGCQWAFTNLIELSLLITGLFAPIAIALSCIPMGVRPLISSLLAFFALSLTKLSYNLMVGLTATVVVLSQRQDRSDIGFLLMIGVFSPVLALGLGAGGGMAVFLGLSSGMSRVAGMFPFVGMLMRR